MKDLDFQNVFEILKNEASTLALASFKDYKDEAQSDAFAFLSETKEQLKTWSLELAEGKLTPEEYEYLILGQHELFEMKALKQKGIARIKVDEFKNNLLKLVITTVLG